MTNLQLNRVLLWNRSVPRLLTAKNFRATTIKPLSKPYNSHLVTPSLLHYKFRAFFVARSRILCSVILGFKPQFDFRVLREQCRGTTRSWCATSPTPVSSWVTALIAMLLLRLTSKKPWKLLDTLVIRIPLILER